MSGRAMVFSALLLAAALALIVCLWFSRPKANILIVPSQTIRAAEVKAEQARQVAIEAEARAVEARPKLEAARAKFRPSRSRPQDYEKTGRREAVKNDIAAQPPPVQTWLRREAQSTHATQGSNKLRIQRCKRSKPAGRGGFYLQEAPLEQQAAGATAFITSRISAETLNTLPEARAEIGNLIELISALDEQLTLEIQRGDAWKAAFEADRELIEALKKDNRAQRLVAQIMTVVTAAAVVILVVVVL